VAFMHVPPFTLEKQLSEIGPELDSAVLRVLHSGHYIGGCEIKDFEESFSELLGLRNVVGCNSGTDALILALRAIGIGPGDEVITPSFSFFATAEAISNVGAQPIFVDIEESSFLIDINEIEKAITSKTKAILPVHLFGCPVDMDKLMNLARKYELKVIEDCAQAVGAKWNNKPVGSWGDIGCFSFFPTKNLGAAGDAGAVSTNNNELAQKIRELAIHGMPKRYFHTNLGYNSRLDALQAAILNVKLPRLAEWVEKRNKVALTYQYFLKELTFLEIPSYTFESGIIHGWNQFVVKVKNFSEYELGTSEEINNKLTNKIKELPKSFSRDWLKKNLEELGVKTIIYYPIPIHLQPAYKNLPSYKATLPITEKICNQVLSLPIFPEITIEQQEYVVQSIKKIFSGLKIQELASSMPSSNTFSV
tara:strand:+ start:52908 stop:54167 length:1260 start_codon:yes stop_codon:yes gene_type:complete